MRKFRVVVVPVVMIVLVMRFEEMRVVFQRARKVEGAAVEHVGQRQAGAGGVMDLRRRIDGADRRFDIAQFVREREAGKESWFGVSD